MAAPSIVVGVDFSEESTIAVKTATELAQRWNAVLRLVHAVSTGDPVVLDSMLAAGMQPQELLDRGRHQLEQLAAELPEDLNVDIEVSESWPGKVLPEAASSADVRAVVVGSRGLDAFDRFMIGSVAQRLARRAPCNVVVCRKKPPTGERIVVGTDFSAPSDEALRQAAELATSDQALEMVHGWIAPVAFTGARLPEPYRVRCEESAREQVARVLGPERKVSFHCQIGRPARVLSERSKELEADLVVVGSHGRRGIKRVILGSEAENTLHHAPCTVWIARNRETGD